MASPVRKQDDRDVELLDQLAAARKALVDQIGRRIVGQHQIVDNLVAALLGGGHALLVGVPGLAKTLLVQTRTGEASREYVISNGALLVDDDVLHQFAFVGLALAGGYDIIAPRATGQAHYRLEARGSEVLDIGRSRVEGRRYALIDAGGSAREVWLDAQGRLLKVALPEKSLVAIRDDPPR